MGAVESPLWTESGSSQFPWEREALEYVRNGLPNHEPFRAWSNVEFIADDGSVNEVDLLIVVPHGFFLVEIKSFPDGVLSGDTQLWKWRKPDGTIRNYDHPLIVTDRKAKRLKSLLARQRAISGGRLPFVDALVFLSGHDLAVRLDGPAKARVVGRAGSNGLLDILEVLKAPSTASLRGTPINRPVSKSIAEAFTQAGIRAKSGHKRLGDWTLGDLLDEGAGWQDFVASRTSPKIERRVRIYLAGRASTKEDEAQLKATAQHEFRLLERLKHPNISQVLDLQQHEHGPALLLDRNPEEERLDLWAEHGLANLDLFDRLALIRQIGEGLQYAHEQGTAHRTLTPRHILVRPTANKTTNKPNTGTKKQPLPQLVIGHWNLGSAEASTRMTTHMANKSPENFSIGIEMAERLAEQDRVYLAPEILVAEHVNPVSADVFSLGAIAALILSGKAPAADVEAREAIFVQHQGFSITDGLSEWLQAAINSATDPTPASRVSSVSEFLGLLDQAIDEETRPAQTDVDPLDAAPGDLLEGGWQLVRRLGSGATAVAVLCQRGPVFEVFKVARSEEHASRLQDEAEVLERLNGLVPKLPGIIEYRGIDRVSGHTTLHLAPAGELKRPEEMTLGSRLRSSGRLGLDTLARWGDDLLEALSGLERAGVAHRDIKPENLGVNERGKNNALHLVLFDFSLAKTSATDITAGTPGYLDPFLSERNPKRWDTSADRYSAAVTLYEMATGARPLWGDGSADPKHLSDTTPTINPGSFDPSVADGLVAFFTKSLNRSPEVRFGTSDEMRVAWLSAVSGIVEPTNHPLPTNGWQETLPVQQLGLSPAAINELEKIGAHTAKELANLTSPQVGRDRTVTQKVKQEILVAAASQRRLRDAANANAEDESVTVGRSIDTLFKKLLPSETGPLRDQRGPLARLLGIDMPVADANGHARRNAWFGSSDFARVGLPYTDDVRWHLDEARSRWSKQLQMKPLREDLISIIQRNEGVCSGDELARGLLAKRGTTTNGEERMIRARALARAALETIQPSDRLSWRRLPNNGGVIVVHDPVESLSDHSTVLEDYAASLGKCADKLAEQQPLASPQRVIAELRAIPRPDGMDELSDARLLRLAADASKSAALSSRGELYPKKMDAQSALNLARGALLVPGALSEEQIRDRVRARFPDSAALPEFSELLPLLRDSLGLEYDPSKSSFRVGGFQSSSLTSTGFSPLSTRFQTRHNSDEATEKLTEIQRKLNRSIKEGGYLLCSVERDGFELAERTLNRLGANQIDLDAELLRHLHHVANEKNVAWDAIIAADAAGPTGPRWGNLQTITNLAIERIENEILTGPAVVVLSRCGLLGHLEQIGLLDRLREATTRSPVPNQTLRTLWVLVPTTDLTAPAAINGRAVPVTPGSTERIALEDAWLQSPLVQH